MNDQDEPVPGAHYQVRALERALDILDSFSASQPELTLTEIAAQIGVPKSTATRLLAVLAARGYLDRSPATDRYRLGVRLVMAGALYRQSSTLEAEARPVLARLAERCQQTANLGVLRQGQIVHLAVVAPDRPLRFYASVGQHEAAHCTGLGKALLAELDDAALAAFVADYGLPARTEHTLTTLDALRAQLAEVRARGVAIDDEEAFLGLRCIAAPIYDDQGQAVAALSISGSAGELTPDTMPDYCRLVAQAARDLSIRLGATLEALPRAGA